MGIIQSVSSAVNSSASIIQTITSTGAGNLLLVAYSVSNSTVGLTITASAGSAQTFTQFGTDINNGGTGQLDGWYVPNCASGTTAIKVTRASGSGQMAIIVTEVSLMNISSPLDQTTSSTSAGTTNTTPVTTQTNEFWWAVFMSASSGAAGLPSVTSISSPWTSDQAPASNLGAGNTDVALGSAYQFASGRGTANATATQNNPDGNGLGVAGMVATFKANLAGDLLNFF